MVFAIWDRFSISFMSKIIKNDIKRHAYYSNKTMQHFNGHRGMSAFVFTLPMLIYNGDSMLDQHINQNALCYTVSDNQPFYTFNGLVYIYVSSVIPY